MKKGILFIALSLFVFYSCSEKTDKIKRDKNLIYFNSKFLAELGDEKYDELEKDLKKGLEVKYLNDIIYISKIVGVNACGNYKGNIEIKEDSLILKHILVSDEVCTSNSIERITYIVKNPTEKQYKLKLKYEEK